MLDHEIKFVQKDASETRVLTSELTEALASMEARAARSEFEEAGTVTLREAISELGVEATPEDLLEVVKNIREQETKHKKVEHRLNRLKLVLWAEAVSIVLCSLLLASLNRTVYDPNWQQARQAEDFQQKLRQSIGPNAKYSINVVPESGRSGSGSQLSITTSSYWSDSPAYPLYALPDGCNITSFDGLDEEGHSDFSGMPFMSASSAYFEFRVRESPFFRNAVSVFYNGRQYRRGYIRKSDLPRLLGGHTFTFYPALVASSRYKVDDIVPLTLSMQSIRDAHGQFAQAYPDLYDTFNFAEGARVYLDEHAWEQYAPEQGK